MKNRQTMPRKAKPRQDMLAERNEAILQAYEAKETLEAIGARFGLTRQRIHQVLDKAKALRRNKHVVDAPA